jgi:hypothetical protein
MALPGLDRIRPVCQSHVHINGKVFSSPGWIDYSQSYMSAKPRCTVNYSLIDRDHPALQSTSNLLTFPLIIPKYRSPQSKSTIVQPPNSLINIVIANNTHHRCEQLLFRNIHVHRYIHNEGWGKVGSMWSFWVVITLAAMYDSCSFRFRFGEEGLEAGDRLLRDERADIFAWS